MITAGAAASSAPGAACAGPAADPAHAAVAARAAERAAGTVLPGEAVTSLARAVDALVGAEWWRCGQESLAGAIVDVERQAARLDAARLRLLAEADARGLTKRAGATCTGAWFANATTSRRTRAGAHVGLAAAVTGPLAATGDALAAGVLNLDHAGVIHRAMNQLPASLDAGTRARCEAFLVERSATFDPGEVAVMGTRMRRALCDDDGHAADREEGRLLAREYLTMTLEEDGAWRLQGLFGPESGARLHAALDALSAPAPAVDGVRDTGTARQRRAQALVHLADTWLTGHEPSRPAAWTTGMNDLAESAVETDTGTRGAAGGAVEGTQQRPTGDPGGALPGSARTHLTVTVPISGILGAREAGATPGCLDGGFPLSPATLAAMTCDAIITPVLVDRAGSPLDVGQRKYAFPKRIRTAITVRDQHCTYPGCRRPSAWCQVHHLITYSRGGGTSERNGTLLCGHHHRIVHARGWRGELDGPRVIWHPPHRDDPHVPPPPWIPSWTGSSRPGEDAGPTPANPAQPEVRAIDGVSNRSP